MALVAASHERPGGNRPPISWAVQSCHPSDSSNNGQSGNIQQVDASVATAITHVASTLVLTDEIWP